jgi:hypothetical protein
MRGVVDALGVSSSLAFTSASVPYTNVTMLAVWGEDTSALIYTTASRLYVSSNVAVTPACR